jgi:hypothetical protein
LTKAPSFKQFTEFPTEFQKIPEFQEHYAQLRLPSLAPTFFFGAPGPRFLKVAHELVGTEWSAGSLVLLEQLSFLD